ncbi:hypothetical protein ACTXT7_003587 [Hymenolepis weldensis]
MKYHPPGIYVISSIEDPNVWNGIISVRKGYYCGGAFPFKVEIPDAFPFSRPPKIVLASNFYHPYVHPTTGELDLGPEFEKWVPGSSHIFHILHYFRCVFNDLSIESVNSNDAKKFANPEVAQAFMLEHEKFEIRARTYVEDHSLWSSTDSTSTDAFPNPLSVIGWQNDNLISTIRDKIANSSQQLNAVGNMLQRTRSLTHSLTNIELMTSNVIVHYASCQRGPSRTVHVAVMLVQEAILGSILLK